MSFRPKYGPKLTGIRSWPRSLLGFMTILVVYGVIAAMYTVSAIYWAGQITGQIE